MPMFGPFPTLVNVDLVQIEADTAGDWVKIGSALWHRTITLVRTDGGVRVTHQARLDDGTVIDVGYVDL